MINITKQIEYWISEADEDIITADWLIKGKRYKEGLFFCHLSVEKVLKAIIVIVTKDIPPKAHDLFYLAKTAKIDLNENDLDFLGILMKYQLEGRYPQFLSEIPSENIVNSYFYKTKEIIIWLKEKL